MNKRKWIGVDLDGTLAEVGRNNLGSIGKPIPAMWRRVNSWLDDDDYDYDVKIFTARAGDDNEEQKIRKWLTDNQLPNLEITNIKDRYMIEIWDDKAVRVERNSGNICEGCKTTDHKLSSLKNTRDENHKFEFNALTDC